MRTYHGALVTLYALRYIPDRNVDSNTTFFIGCTANRIVAICIGQEFADRQIVAFLEVRRNADLLDEIRQVLARIGYSFILGICPGSRNLDFNNTGYTAFYGFAVHVDDLFTLSRIGLDDGIFHVLHGIINRNDVCKLEESCLQDRIGTIAQADFHSNLRGIDNVEGNMFLRNLAFDAGFQVFIQVIYAPAAVEEEDTAIFNFADNIVILNIGFFVAGNEISRFYIIGRPDRYVTKTQMRFCYATGFLRIVFKISLYVLVRVIADDLDGVLVGANRTVRAKAPELAADDAFGLEVHRYERNGQVRNVIFDTNREVFLRRIAHEVYKYRFNMGRRNVLRGQAIAAGNNHGRAVRILEGCADIFIKRFANSTRFFRAVENSNAFYRLRQGRKEVFQRERTIEVYLEIADFSAFGRHDIDAFLNSAGNGAHGDDDVFRIRSAIIVKQLVRTARIFADLVHVILNDIRKFIIVRVNSFTVLEEDIRVVNAAAQGRTVRIEAFMFKFVESITIEEFA